LALRYKVIFDKSISDISVKPMCSCYNRQME